MKKIAVFGILLMASVRTHCMDYAITEWPKGTIMIPDTAVLYERLCKRGFAEFARETNLLRDIAGKEKKIESILAAVQIALHEYKPNKRKPLMPYRMRIQRVPLILTIIEDHIAQKPAERASDPLFSKL